MADDTQPREKMIPRRDLPIAAEVADAEVLDTDKLAAAQDLILRINEIVERVEARRDDYTSGIEHDIEELEPLFIEMFHDQVWKLFGDGSLDGFVRDHLPKFPREMFNLKALREGGLSVRAIEAVTGIPRSTVQDRLLNCPDPDSSDDRPGDHPRSDDRSTPNTPENQAPRDDPETPSPVSTGLDGKRRPRKAAAKKAAAKPRAARQRAGDANGAVGETNTEYDEEPTPAAVTEATDEEIDIEYMISQWIGTLNDLGRVEGRSAMHQMSAAQRQWAAENPKEDE
jgi:hypothetical protein